MKEKLAILMSGYGNNGKHRRSVCLINALIVPFIVFSACKEATPSKKASAENTAAKGGAASDEQKDTGALAPGAFQDEGSVRPKGSVREEPVLKRLSFPKPKAGQMVMIPGGILLAGSSPTDVLRVQYAENDLVPYEMHEFEIDALPYPGDPNNPFLTNVTRAEAEQYCAEAGKRLCTELEWEWACKSKDNRRYPMGNIYDDSAYSPLELLEPSSPCGVFAMGRILEWTSSAWGEETDQVERAVARGFAEGLDEPPNRGRRCAKRWRRMEEGAHPLLGFRCCLGEINKAVCFIERIRPPFSLYSNMKPDKFVKIIRSIKELEPVFDNPRMFSDADIRAVLARRNTDKQELEKQRIVFEYKPVRWIPRQGMELWVAVGRGDKHSFIVALHETKDNEEYVHASSLILWNQPIPLALAYREGHRDSIYWAPCWGCRDGGEITFDDAKNEVIITHKW